MKHTIFTHFFVFIRSFDFFLIIQQHQASAVVPSTAECCYM